MVKIQWETYSFRHDSLKPKTPVHQVIVEHKTKSMKRPRGKREMAPEKERKRRNERKDCIGQRQAGNF